VTKNTSSAAQGPTTAPSTVTYSNPQCAPTQTTDRQPLRPETPSPAPRSPQRRDCARLSDARGSSDGPG
jgi:hypothetical protein